MATAISIEIWDREINPVSHTPYGDVICSDSIRHYMTAREIPCSWGFLWQVNNRLRTLMAEIARQARRGLVTARVLKSRPLTLGHSTAGALVRRKLTRQRRRATLKRMRTIADKHRRTVDRYRSQSQA